MKLGEPCELYDRTCIECGECEKCDLDPSKICDNCMQCLQNDSDYRAVTISGIELEDETEELPSKASERSFLSGRNVQ